MTCTLDRSFLVTASARTGLREVPSVTVGHAQVASETPRVARDPGGGVLVLSAWGYVLDSSSPNR